jgi:hypothetical protein
LRQFLLLIAHFGNREYIQLFVIAKAVNEPKISTVSDSITLFKGESLTKAFPFGTHGRYLSFLSGGFLSDVLPVFGTCPVTRQTLGQKITGVEVPMHTQPDVSAALNVNCADAVFRLLLLELA